jgi:prepilin-type N-terminal cleavage/methylation domain-containing protein
MNILLGKKGFSLLELLVVIAIFVIGLAIATPSLMEIGRRNSVKSSARQIKDVLYSARMRAIELNEAIGVQFNINNESYTTLVISSGRVLGRHDFKNVDINVNINPSTVRWNTRGSTTDPCTITVQNVNAQYNVIVAATGNVRIVIP